MSSLFFFDRTIKILIQANINFITMRISTYSKIKTINLDSDIFTQDFTPAKSKLPSHLLKTLVQRKRKQSKNHRSFVDKVCKPISMENSSYLEDDDPFQRSNVKQNDLQKTQKDSFITKNHSKTNPSASKYTSTRGKTSSFKRYTPNLKAALELNEENIRINEEDELLRQNLFEIDMREMNKIQPKPTIEEQAKHKLNPYTKDEYIYMKNRQLDQIMKLKRSGKLRRISSITKSYKVSTIELAPQNHRRTISFKMSPSLNSKQNTYNNKSCFRSPLKKESEIQPSPWEWAVPESSRDELP